MTSSRLELPGSPVVLAAAASALAAIALLFVPTPAGSAPGPTWSVWGRSVDGRAIKVRRSGDLSSKFKVLVVGSVHGDEPQGIRIADRITRRYSKGLRGVDLWTMRTLNPDGTRAGTRGNSRGVDLNRNFPYRWDPHLDGGYDSGPRPLSEPESKTLERIGRRVVFDIAIFYHQPWGMTLTPCNRTRPIAARYAKLSGLRGQRSCDRYYPGSAIGWLHHRFGTSAFVVELGPGALTRTRLRRHARAVLRLSRQFRPAVRPAGG